MALTQSRPAEQSQRIDVELDRSGVQEQVKIRIESFDENLGWYTAGSIRLPLHQLPLLEQAIEQMRRREFEEDEGKVLPFPGVETRVS